MDKVMESLMKGNFTEQVSVTVESAEGLPEGISLAEAAAMSDDKLPKAVIVTVEAIHAGMTKNKTFYPGDKLEASVPTWTTPYERPVIKNHNTWAEPTGRVKEATFRDSILKPETKTIELKLRITDEDAIKKVLDGRYQTLSIGGSTNEARCSICAKNIVKEGWCGHSKGRTYDGKEAYWIIGEMEFNEISWVNVPADVNARVIGVKAEEGTTEGRKESVEDTTNTTITEGAQVDDLSIIDDLLNENTDTPGTTTEGEEPEGTENPEGDAATQTEGAEQTDAEKLAEANERIAALELEVEGLKESNTTLEGEKEVAETAVTEKDAEIVLLKEERDSFRDKSVTLARTAHKFLAESAVNLRVALGEATKEEREELIKDYAKTPAKVLESTINDLLDKPAKTQREQATPAKNPGAVITDGAHSVDADGNIIEAAGGNQEEVTVDIEELAKRMIGVIANAGRF